MTWFRLCLILDGAQVRQLTKAIKANREIHIILLNYKKDLTPFWNLLHLTPILVRASCSLPTVWLTRRDQHLLASFAAFDAADP